MPKVLIDTNVVSAIIARNPVVLRHAADYRRGGAKFIMAPIVYYEYRRGILERGRDRDGRAQTFDRFVIAECEWADQDRAVSQRASWVWSRYPGQRVPDADTLIAGTALHHRLSVATRNRRHLERFGVPVVDWFQERAPRVRTRAIR